MKEYYQKLINLHHINDKEDTLENVIVLFPLKLKMWFSVLSCYLATSIIVYSQFCNHNFQKHVVEQKTLWPMSIGLQQDGVMTW